MTNCFPKWELYGMSSQIRRASASIPTIIAEGCGRQGNAELNRFLQNSAGSASELEYLLLLSRDLGLIDETIYDDMNTRVCEVKRMLAALIRKIANDRGAGEK